MVRVFANGPGYIYIYIYILKIKLLHRECYNLHKIYTCK